MKLSQYRETYYTLSGKASDIARQLSLAGIALVWIFKTGAGDNIILPKELIWPTVFFAASLTADLLQYFIASSIWGIFQRFHEKKLNKITDDPDLAAPAWFNRPTLTLWCIKIVFVIIGYILVGIYMAKILLK